jgi:hypothetical protein
LGDSPAFLTDAASGSGCTPGSGTLPDGWWYGLSVTANADHTEFTFDLACYYTGPIAETIAAGRGDEVNNDYYVVNDNPTLRTVPVAAGATASCVELGGADLNVPCAISDIPDSSVPWAVWFRVVGGRVDRAVEQYAP